MSRWGRLDVVVNNAGLMTFRAIVDLTADDWRAVLGVDLLGAAGVFVTLVDDATLDVRVDGDGGHVLDLIRDGADDLGLALHAMTTRRTSLDELFLDQPS